MWLALKRDNENSSVMWVRCHITAPANENINGILLTGIPGRPTGPVFPESPRNPIGP